MNKILLIYNPVSGRNNMRMNTVTRFIQEAAKEYAVIVYEMKKDESFVPFLEQTQEDCEFVVCCGGDGSLHRVVNDLMMVGQRIPLAYIPIGSTNDYAKTLGINSKNAIQKALHGKNMCIDLGRFNGQYFNYVAAFGIFTDVSYTTPQSVKNVLGYLAYLLEGVKQIGKLEGRSVKIELDDRKIEGNMIVGMVFNALSIAGKKSKNMNPANLYDGKLEYLFVKCPKNVVDIQAIITYLLKENLDNEFMYYGQAECFKITSEEMEWTLDGEYGGKYDNVEIMAVPRALEVKIG